MTDSKTLDDSWKNWTKENLDRKCDPFEVHCILLQHGFDPASIRQAMGPAYPNDNIDHAAFAAPRITRPDNGLNARKFDTDKLQLYVVEDCLTPQDCAGLLDIINENLRDSTITNENETDKAYRTSKTCDLGLMDNAFVREIDEKIARTLGINLSYSEAIQGQRYEVGQEFKQHTDYFEPGTQEYMEHAIKQGNRTWTFMIYLNEVPKGGGTRFFGINQTFYPKPGRALVWNNLLANGAPNPHTMHSGEPVEEGHKVIITKWFRERGIGPIFYE